jgi:DNA primase
VKQQADIVKVIEGYIRLRNAGAQRFKGLCPFHKEKTPSFNVNGGSQQFFYCFGCQASGDVFSFVGKIENVGFPEAVRVVAQKCGIPLPKREFSSPEEAAGARMRAKLLDLHEAATAWFEEQMRGPEGALAREYLALRGLDPKGIEKFRIGYAPDSFNALRDRLSGMADQETLRASGLFSSKEQGDGSQGPIYDRFRKRVVFPICNEGGRVIAFTARALESGEKAGAKYINSPETPLYTKGQVLFNLDKAKSAIRQIEFALLVEGQMDCISVYMAGIHNVLAVSGTAFTEAQVRLVARFTKRVIVNFDPDTAGATATEKSIGLLTEEDFDVKVATLEGGLDPDRFVHEQGIQAYGAALRGAKRYSDYLIERARTQFPGRTAEAKVNAMNFLLPHIRRMTHPIKRNQFAEDAANKLGIDSALMREELKQAAAQRVASVPTHREEPLTETERILLRALVLKESETARMIASTSIADHPEWIADLATADLLDALAHAPAPANPLDAASTEEARAHLAHALDYSPQPSDPPLTVQVEGALHTLEQRRLERRQRELRSQIAEADRRGDQEMLARLIGDKLEIDRKLRDH